MPCRLPIIVFLSWLGIACSQEWISSRAMVFDRGLTDASEPYLSVGNPALLTSINQARFFGQVSHLQSPIFCLSYSTPLSISTVASICYATESDIERLRESHGSVDYQRTYHGVMLNLGHRFPWNLGQRIEMNLTEYEPIFVQTSENTAEVKKRQIAFAYRMGTTFALSHNLILGVQTPALVNIVSDAYGRTTRQKTRYLEDAQSHWPLLALNWQPNAQTRFALSNRSEGGNKDAQLAMEKMLTPLFHGIVAARWSPAKQQCEGLGGLGAHLSGVDAFWGFDLANSEMRIALSFAPEGRKELISCEIPSRSVQSIYPYRIQAGLEQNLTVLQVVNKINTPVEIQICLQAPGLPRYKNNLRLGSLAAASIKIPLPRNLVECEPGNYLYELSVTALMRGRQTITMEIPVDLKDEHDWSGEWRDLFLFLQPSHPAIFSLARKWTLPCNSDQPGWSSLKAAECIYEELRRRLRYVPDPQPLQLRQDRLQYPTETLTLGSGDCEDISLLMASLLQSLGIAVAFIDVMPPSGDGHLFILFEMTESAESLIAKDDNLYHYIWRNTPDGNLKMYLPLELTALHLPFAEACRIAHDEYEQFAIQQGGLNEGWMKVYDPD